MTKTYKVVISKDGLTWMQNAIGRILAKVQADPTLVSDDVKTLMDLDESLDKAEVIKSSEESSEPKKKPSKTKAASVNYNYCPTCPKYGAKRAPRTDCEGCWKAYKELNPMQYEAARRAFEYKQKQKKKKA